MENLMMPSPEEKEKASGSFNQVAKSLLLLQKKLAHQANNNPLAQRLVQDL
jgi:hypothetical protein